MECFILIVQDHKKKYRKIMKALSDPAGDNLRLIYLYTLQKIPTKRTIYRLDLDVHSGNFFCLFKQNW
jgi:hypothetical protein